MFVCGIFSLEMGCKYRNEVVGYRTSLSIFNLSLMQKVRVSTHFLLNLSMRSLIRFLMKNSGTAKYVYYTKNHLVAFLDIVNI